MAFSQPWNENDPADTDLANQLGDDVRDLKLQIRERMAVDHEWSITDTPATGYTKMGSARPFYQGSPPANNPDAPGAIWINSTTGAVSRDNGVIWVDISFGIPQGGIIMWSGLIAAIPAGYKLCDGTAGTPDLREKFVRGAAAGVDPGTIAGSDTHAHTMGPMTPASTVVTVDVSVPTVNVATAGHNHQDFSDNQPNIPAYFAVAFIMKA